MTSETRRTAVTPAARGLAAVSAVLLLTGLLLPYLTYEQGGERTTTETSLLTFGTGALGFRGSDGRHDSVSVTLGVAFLGLALVTLVAVGCAVVVMAGRPSPRAARVAATLLLLGLVGAWATVLLAWTSRRGDADVDVHVGLPVFSVGVLLDAWLVLRRAAVSPR